MNDYTNGQNEVDVTLDEQREVSLRDFLSVLFRRRGIIAGVFLASLAIVFFMNSRSVVLYDSTSTIRVSRGLPESAFSSRMRVLTWEEEVNSEIETIQSAQVVSLAQEILDEASVLDSSGQPMKIKAGNVTAKTTGKSAVMYISYRSSDPVTAQEGAAAVTRAYTDFRLQVRGVPLVDEFFREEISGLREQLDEWEQERAQFMNDESVVRISDERINLLAIRQQADVDLNRTRATLAEQEAKVEVLRNRLISGNDELELYAFTDGQDNDDILTRLRTEVVVERSNLYDATSQYTDDHPRVQALRDQLALVEDDLRREVRRYIGHLEARVEVLQAREEASLRTIGLVDSELQRLPQKEARLASFDRVLDQLKANYSALVDKQIQAQIERTGKPDWNVLVLQPATDPVAIRINDYVRMLLIPMLSLIVATALAFLVDGLDHTLKDASEVENQLRLPVLGSVGKIR